MSDILPVPNALLGIDVSHWQGLIDWNGVAAARFELPQQMPDGSIEQTLYQVAFAWIKATDGATVDPLAETNCQGAAAVGLPFGLYHFWRPQLPAAQQTNLFLERVTDITTSEFALALDIETGALTEDNQEDALAWLAQVDETIPHPLKPPVYVAPSYAQINLTDPVWLGYPLWVAHFTDAAQPNIVKWPRWTFWQRQSDGEIPGITGVVDIDWFNGSAEDFQKLIRVPA